MFKYFILSLFLMSNIAQATDFQLIPWRLQPRANTYIAVMPEAQATSQEYLGDGNLGRSNIYLENAAHNNIKVPAIHAYNPKTCRMAAIELDPALRALLPANLPIPAADVTRLFISIELLDEEPLRFRPHRFVDRACPTYAQAPQYNNAPQIQAGVFALDGTQIQFTDLPGAGLIQTAVSIHAGAPVPAENIAGTQILSPNNMHIPPVAGNPSRAYYSVVSHNDGKQRAAVTLHWLVSDADANETWRVLARSPSIEVFSLQLAASRFGGRPEALEVQKLLPQLPAADNQDGDDDLELALALSATAPHGENGGAFDHNDLTLALGLSSSSSTSTAAQVEEDSKLAEALALADAIASSLGGQ